MLQYNFIPDDDEPPSLFNILKSYSGYNFTIHTFY